MLNEMGINVVEQRGGRRRRGGQGRRGAPTTTTTATASWSRPSPRRWPPRRQGAVRAHRRSGAHVSARDGLGRAAVPRGRDRHRQAHRGRPRGDDRGPVRKPADLPGHHHLARRAEQRKGVPARHHRSRSDLRRPRRQEQHGEQHGRQRPGRPGMRTAQPAAPAGRTASRRARRCSTSRRRARAGAARAAAQRAAATPARSPPATARSGEGGETPPGDSDFDDDDMENSLSLAAIEAELKPKVVETFDKIADSLQAAAPPAGPGHPAPAQERHALARAGAQVQEAQGRDHRRGEVAAAQPGPHRRAGRAALRHQQAAGRLRGPADAAVGELRRRRARTS